MNKEKEVLFEFNNHKFRREGVKELKKARVRVTCTPACCSKPLHMKITMIKKDFYELCEAHAKTKGVEPVINKILDMSTCHITEKDDDMIVSANTVIIEHKTDHGYFVWVPNKAEMNKDFFDVLEKAKYSKQFIRILKIAQGLGCVYVHFDSDGTVYDGLKQYSW